MARTQKGRDKDRGSGLRTVGGTAAGAAAGSLFGPLGAAVGAVVGGVAAARTKKLPKLKPLVTSAKKSSVTTRKKTTKRGKTSKRMKA